MGKRYHISVLCKEGFSKTETAKKINRHILPRPLLKLPSCFIKHIDISRNSLKIQLQRDSPGSDSDKLRIFGIQIGDERICLTR